MKNVRPTGYGFQLYTKVQGRFVSQHRPTPPKPQDVKNWVEEQRVRARLGAALPTRSDQPTFAEDVQTYLAQVTSMATYRHRRDDLTRWVKVFGTLRTRRQITAGDIRTQLEKWRAEGYAASTCNHRRTALMHLWSVLDGKSAQNPARDVPRYQEEPGPPRALSQTAIRLVLRAMPYSQTKARCALMRWTGWPQAQMMKLTPGDINWHVAVFVRARRKGKGAAGAWLPVLPQAWRVLRSYKRLGCWGQFSTSSMRKSLRLAAEKVRSDPDVPAGIKAELADVTPYQLRHSFLTLVAGITQDDRAVKMLAQHADIRQTHRYTEASVDPRVAAAIAKVQLALGKRPRL